jgi:hypothetical protein
MTALLLSLSLAAVAASIIVVVVDDVCRGLVDGSDMAMAIM